MEVQGRTGMNCKTQVCEKDTNSNNVLRDLKTKAHSFLIINISDLFFKHRKPLKAAAAV